MSSNRRSTLLRDSTIELRLSKEVQPSSKAVKKLFRLIDSDLSKIQFLSGKIELNGDYIHDLEELRILLSSNLAALGDLLNAEAQKNNPSYEGVNFRRIKTFLSEIELLESWIASMSIGVYS